MGCSFPAPSHFADKSAAQAVTEAGLRTSLLRGLCAGVRSASDDGILGQEPEFY